MAVDIRTYDGRRFSSTCRDAVAEWDRLATAENIPFRITQGGFNGTNVSASAGTHAGDALDLSVQGLSKAQVTRLITIGRMLGFAAWFRTTRVGKWGTRAHGFSSYHIHAVPNGWGSPSRGAKNQATSYRNGRDGLASNQADLGPGHVSTYRTRTWIGYLTSTSPRPSTPSHTNPTTPTGGLTVSDINTILAELAVIKGNTASAFGALGGREYISEHNRTTGNYILSYPVHRGGEAIKLIQEIADTRSATMRLEGQLAGLTTAIKSLAAGQGVDLAAVSAATKKAVEEAVSDVDVDEDAIISGVVAEITPAIRAAVIEAQGDVDGQAAAAFADAVLDNMYKRLEA